jgi:hypothetical protein
LEALKRRVSKRLNDIILPTRSLADKIQALQTDMMPTGSVVEKDFLKAAVTWALAAPNSEAAQIAQDVVLAAMSQVKLSQY